MLSVSVSPVAVSARKASSPSEAAEAGTGQVPHQHQRVGVRGGAAGVGCVVGADEGVGDGLDGRTQPLRPPAADAC